MVLALAALPALAQVLLAALARVLQAQAQVLLALAQALVLAAIGGHIQPSCWQCGTGLRYVVKASWVLAVPHVDWQHVESGSGQF